MENGTNCIRKIKNKICATLQKVLSRSGLTKIIDNKTLLPFVIDIFNIEKKDIAANPHHEGKPPTPSLVVDSLADFR